VQQRRLPDTGGAFDEQDSPIPRDRSREGSVNRGELSLTVEDGDLEPVLDRVGQATNGHASDCCTVRTTRPATIPSVPRAPKFRGLTLMLPTSPEAMLGEWPA
jgi:hypothetical protein